jgi:hypothetical protein
MLEKGILEEKASSLTDPTKYYMLKEHLKV